MADTYRCLDCGYEGPAHNFERRGSPERRCHSCNSLLVEAVDPTPTESTTKKESSMTTTTRILPLVLLALFALDARAGNPPPKQNNGGDTTNTNINGALAGALAGAAAVNKTDVDVSNKNTNVNANLGVNLQGQAQGQHQGQDQGQAQHQAQNAYGGTGHGGSATASNAGNSQSMTYNEAEQPSRLSIRTVPTAIAPDAYPSAPCRVSGSAGGSWLGGGISFGGSKMDHECDKRETARSFALLGQYEAALRILCSTRAARESLGPDCVNYPAPGPATEQPAVVVIPEGVSPKELQERDRRIIESIASK